MAARVVTFPHPNGSQQQARIEGATGPVVAVAINARGTQLRLSLTPHAWENPNFATADVGTPQTLTHHRYGQRSGHRWQWDKPLSAEDAVPGDRVIVTTVDGTRVPGIVAVSSHRPFGVVITTRGGTVVRLDYDADVTGGRWIRNRIAYWLLIADGTVIARMDADATVTDLTEPEPYPVGTRVRIPGADAVVTARDNRDGDPRCEVKADGDDTRRWIREDRIQFALPSAGTEPVLAAEDAGHADPVIGPCAATGHTIRGRVDTVIHQENGVAIGLQCKRTIKVAYGTDVHDPDAELETGPGMVLAAADGGPLPRVTVDNDPETALIPDTCPVGTEPVTAADHRAHAADADRRAQESFDRCDTDGYLSQWAHGRTAARDRLQAEIMERGGTWTFPALFDADTGEMVPAKWIDGRYGPVWGLLSDGDPRSRFTGWFNASEARKGTRRWTTDHRKGFVVGRVEVPARAELRGGDVMTVTAVPVRTDGGFSPDVRVVCRPVDGPCDCCYYDED